MDIPERRQMAATLGREGAATSDDVAAAVVQAWHGIDRNLASIVGHAGVAALYRRSLHICAGAHPAVMQALGPTQRALDAEPLRAILQAQSAADAAMLGADLLQTFHELFARMVGPSLTERLLRSVWDDIPGAAPTEGSSS